jgi:hypothetical protein
LQVCGSATESEERRRIGCGAVIMQELILAQADQPRIHNRHSVGAHSGRIRHDEGVSVAHCGFDHATVLDSPIEAGIVEAADCIGSGDCFVDQSARFPRRATLAMSLTSKRQVGDLPTSNLLVAGLVVEALVRYLAVFPSARRDLLHLDSTAAALEGDVVLPL